MADHNTVGVPIGTRLLRVVRTHNGWKLWLATRDYVHGTFLMCMDDGSVSRITVRTDEPDEVRLVRPRDEEIKSYD